MKTKFLFPNMTLARTDDSFDYYYSKGPRKLRKGPKTLIAMVLGWLGGSYIEALRDGEDGSFYLPFILFTLVAFPVVKLIMERENCVSAAFKDGKLKFYDKYYDKTYLETETENIDTISLKTLIPKEENNSNRQVILSFKDIKTEPLTFNYYWTGNSKQEDYFFSELVRLLNEKTSTNTIEFSKAF